MKCFRMAILALAALPLRDTCHVSCRTRFSSRRRRHRLFGACSLDRAALRRSNWDVVSQRRRACLRE
jgi:hypothetical protein